ncbi:MAG: YhbY family RNA-binding protein [Vicinamibacterales bacterium]|nr:YhbY family RNA-binding protein [Vicinamibacterales bacterium]
MTTDLTPRLRRELSARAHHLEPVVTVGQRGLTDAVVREIDAALAAHELIKVRADVDDRGARGAMLEAICARTGASPVKQVGKILVLWRQRPAEPS